MAGEVAPGVSTNFGGLSINGAVLSAVTPFQNVRGGLPCGRTLYVSSNGGLDRNGSTAGGFGDGTNIDAPFATIAAAMSALQNRTNRGDVIYVLPGHVESVSSADYFSNTGTASGFSIIGLGSGTQRPILTWTTATSTWLFDTDGVEIANMNLYTAGPLGSTTALTVAAPITVSAANCRIVGCTINGGVDADQLATIPITTTAAADNFEFIGNYCIGATASGIVTFLRLVGVDDGLVANNYIRAATTVATVGPVQCLTTASTNLRLTGNYIANMKSDATIAFTPMTATTGIVAGNFFYVDGSGILPITAGLMEWFGNYVVNDQGEAGALVGTASA